MRNLLILAVTAAVGLPAFAGDCGSVLQSLPQSAGYSYSQSTFTQQALSRYLTWHYPGLYLSVCPIRSAVVLFPASANVGGGVCGTVVLPAECGGGELPELCGVYSFRRTLAVRSTFRYTTDPRRSPPATFRRLVSLARQCGTTLSGDNLGTLTSAAAGGGQFSPGHRLPGRIRRTGTQ
jgi:hypothetical protein